MIGGVLLPVRDPVVAGLDLGIPILTSLVGPKGGAFASTESSAPRFAHRFEGL